MKDHGNGLPAAPGRWAGSDAFLNLTLAAMVLAGGAVVARAIGSHGHEFTRWQSFLICGVSPSALALLTASILSPKRIRQGVLVSVVATLAAVWLMNAALAILPGEGAPVQSAHLRNLRLARAQGLRFDPRSGDEVTLDLWKSGVEAYPFADFLLAFRPLRSPRGEYMPLGQISNVMSVGGNENGEYFVYRSDEHGFCNPPGIWKSGKLQVAIVGDSFAQGCHVKPDESFAAVIRRRYPRTLNLGMAQFTVLREYAVIREYVAKLKPRVVLWCFFEGNDLQDLYLEGNHPLLMQYVERCADWDLIDRQTEIDAGLRESFKREFGEAFERLKDPKKRPPDRSRGTVASILKMRPVRERLGLVFDPPLDYSLFEYVMRRAVNRVRSYGGRFHFVYLPAWERYAGSRQTASARARLSELHGRVVGGMRSLGVNVIDVPRAFDAHPDPVSLYPFRQHGHYTPEGNRLVAETILKALENEGL